MTIDEAIKLIDHPVFAVDHPVNWADFGAGGGLFTNAIATRLQPGSTVTAVDKSLKGFKTSDVKSQVKIQTIETDFTKFIDGLPPLHGILMANSLHFVPNPRAFLAGAMKYFIFDPSFLVIEYDMDEPNPWVPHPISYGSLKKLFSDLGLKKVEKILEVPSRYNRSNIYSAIIT